MKEYPWFVRGDLDGFLGLLTDNLLQLMVIIVLPDRMCSLFNISTKAQSPS